MSEIQNNFDSKSHLFPMKLLEKCLELISMLSLSFSEGMNPNMMGGANSPWLEFLTYISYLPSINLFSYNYTDNELLCIFLNLYHIMVLHAFIVAGPPSTVLRWPNFFNSYSYEAFGDIFSLSELEHCIIKSGLDPPNNMIAQVLIPQSNYDFNLKRKDYRLLWALNCGSISMPSHVPIFTPNSCEEQLDLMMRESMLQQLQVENNSNNISIILPQMCQLYFSLLVESSPVTNNSNSLLAVLQIIADYASPSQRNILRYLLLNKEKVSYSVKYQSLDFRCRFFSVMK